MTSFHNVPDPIDKKSIIGRLPLAVAGLILACVCVELVLYLADHKIIGTTRWRSLTYQYGAFWAGLLHNWRPNYAVQPATMFVTYSFLHSGIMHLLGNMLALAWLGAFACARIGQVRFILLYFLAAIFGGLFFGVITSNGQPMVGASGALFGLAGAWQFWTWQDKRSVGEPVRPVIVMVLVLVALNIVMWLSTQGQLAWETHLGGFVTGWIYALFLQRRGVSSHPE